MHNKIVFIHGFRGTHHGLSLIAKEFEETVLAPDLPGFGEGVSLDAYSLENYVTWLYGYIKQSKSHPVLVGHSFGSIICAAYAAKYPKTITKLVLINPIGAPALEGPRAVLSKLALLYYKVGEKLPEQLARTWLSSPAMVRFMSEVMAKTNDKALRRYIHDQHSRYFSRFHTRASLSEAFATSINHSVRDVAPLISTPTLLIAGDKDDITPLRDQETLHGLFDDATLEVLRGVGHLSHYEAPREVAGMIQAFMTRS